MPLVAADMHRAARIFKALAHPHRIQIACILSNGRSATQKDLVLGLGWPQSTVARHLGLLRQHGLVRATRKGGELLLELDGTVTPRLLEIVCNWVHPDTGEQFATAGATTETPHATA